LDQVSHLPRAQQKDVSAMPDTVLQQAARWAAKQERSGSGASPIP